MSLRSGILEVFDGMGKTIPEGREESIVSSGILDSISILEMVNALEDKFDIFFEEEDLTLESFDKLSGIESLIGRRRSETPA